MKVVWTNAAVHVRAPITGDGTPGAMVVCLVAESNSLRYNWTIAYLKKVKNNIMAMLFNM